MIRNKNQNMIKTYVSYSSMLLDVSYLSDKLDLNASLSGIPDFSFKTKDGKIHLAANFVHMAENFHKVLGLDINPKVCKQWMGSYVISYNKYEKVPESEKAPIEVKAVDSPAKKRATRIKKED